MAEVTEEMKAQVQEILANPTPENVEKYPDLFQFAEKQGLIKKNDGGQAAPDPILTEIQARYGDGYKTKEDFFATVDKLQSGGAGLEFLQTLPEPIINVIETYTKKGPWETYFNKGAVLDYTKDYSDIELVEIKYPGKFTAEELADTENVAVKSAKAAAKESFLIEKGQKATSKRLESDRIAQGERKAKESLEASITDWKNKMKVLQPNLTPDQLSSMESRMRSELSTGKFYEKFVNKDGTFNIEAASNLYPINHPKEFTGVWMERGKLIAEKGAHDILDNGGKARASNAGAGAPKTPNKESKEVLDKIFQGKTKPTYALNTGK